jgi:hypothetical protein
MNKDGEIVIDKYQEESEDPSQKSWIAKTTIFLGGLVMIILMISYVFVSFPVGDLIIGQLESNPLNDDKIELNDFTIFFTSGIHEELQQIYLAEQEVEFSVCLIGDKMGEDYIITTLYQPKMFTQSFNHVSFEPCSKETLIMLHSHPYKSCVASDTDINTLKKMKKVNADVLMVVMCEPDRFSVYN